MVIPVGAAIEGDYDYVAQDIKAVADACHPGAILKVILENCLLSKEQIAKVCEICVEQGADFVKTSTGFSTGGATVEDVKLMKSVVGDKAKVKAAGGIRTTADAKAMIAAGADRIGASAGIANIAGFLT